MPRILHPTRSFSLDAGIDPVRIVAFNVGADGDVWIVEGLEALDYRTADNGFATFPKTRPASPQRYRVWQLRDGNVVRDRLIEGEQFNVHDVQPVGEDLLLVCVRSQYRGPGDFDLNGRVYDGSGRLRRAILLGDGIQTIQATAGGTIWASYFDEGVYGNFGWNHPVGASGLIEWSADGTKLYEYEPNAEVGVIDDCYALNVAANGDVWCYYYSDFPLVQLRDNRIVGTWRIPVAGSHAFAIHDDTLLLCGSYKQKDRLYVVGVRPGETARMLREFDLHDRQGQRISLQKVVGRGGSLHVLDGHRLHVVSLPVQ
jgi:hypothetical protein